MLKENDIIILKFPNRVFTDIPNKYLLTNFQYSEKESKEVASVGYDLTSFNDVTGLRRDLKKTIEDYLWKIDGLKTEPDIVTRFVNYVLPVPQTTKWQIPEGEYLVLHAETDGHGITQVMAIYHQDDPTAEKIYIGFTQGAEGMPGNLENVKVVKNLFA